MDGPVQADSASTSITQLDMAQGDNRVRTETIQPVEPVLHEPRQSSSPLEEKADSSEGLNDVPTVPQTPQVYLTFLIISGKRRTMSFEPGTTVGRLKELMWNSWPSDWEDERPTAPSFLRVLYLGRMLQDDETLSQLNFPAHTPQTNSAPIPTIVHLSVRPFTTQSEPDIKKKRKNRPSDGPQNAGTQDDVPEGAGCCGCVIC
ncbi:Ubiquitin-like protein 3 [Termitomyces sp. T112]|nr:Ubiquitin-like protein 3 [Termitomyces sp. T112]